MHLLAIALTWALLLAVSVTQAQMLRSIQSAINAYENALAAAESGECPRCVEAAFAALQDVADVLKARSAEGASTVLESLPDFQYALAQRLPGVVVARVEVVAVSPDAEYFRALAARVGDEADRRFAEALAMTYDGYWPAYVKRQTDESGCTAFGEGRHLDIWLAWSAMERDFPGRYVAAVVRERDSVVSQITGSTCACGDAASVVWELERVASALSPAHPIRPVVDARLMEVRDGRSNIRFGCISG